MIAEFIRRSGVPFTTIFYDEIATNPKAFDRLFRFLGLSPQRSALNYWTKEHHGFAANGASSLLLRSLPQPRFTTGDDAFYSSIGPGNFYDQRWIQGLSVGEKE